MMPPPAPVITMKPGVGEPPRELACLTIGGMFGGVRAEPNVVTLRMSR